MYICAQRYDASIHMCVLLLVCVFVCMHACYICTQVYCIYLCMRLSAYMLFNVERACVHIVVQSIT